MNININKLLILLLWILMVILVTGLILWPIYSNNLEYKFYFQNILFISMPLLLVRYIFAIKLTFLENTIIPKFVFFPLSIALILYSYNGMNEFIDFYRSNGIYYSMEKFSLDKQSFLGNYIFDQFIFFSVFSIICGIVTPFALLRSIWRVYNKGME